MREACWRCGAEMEWRHSTWQCPRCRFKLGCCEGECPEPLEAVPSAAASAPPAAPGPVR